MVVFHPHVSFRVVKLCWMCLRQSSWKHKLWIAAAAQGKTWQWEEVKKMAAVLMYGSKMLKSKQGCRMQKESFHHHSSIRYPTLHRFKQNTLPASDGAKTN